MCTPQHLHDAMLRRACAKAIGYVSRMHFELVLDLIERLATSSTLLLRLNEARGIKNNFVSKRPEKKQVKKDEPVNTGFLGLFGVGGAAEPEEKKILTPAEVQQATDLKAMLNLTLGYCAVFAPSRGQLLLNLRAQIMQPLINAVSGEKGQNSSLKVVASTIESVKLSADAILFQNLENHPIRDPFFGGISAIANKPEIDANDKIADITDSLRKSNSFLRSSNNVKVGDLLAKSNSFQKQNSVLDGNNTSNISTNQKVAYKFSARSAHLDINAVLHNSHLANVAYIINTRGISLDLISDAIVRENSDVQKMLENKRAQQAEFENHIQYASSGSESERDSDEIHSSEEDGSPKSPKTPKNPVIIEKTATQFVHDKTSQAERAVNLLIIKAAKFEKEAIKDDPKFNALLGQQRDAIIWDFLALIDIPEEWLEAFLSVHSPKLEERAKVGMRNAGVSTKNANRGNNNNSSSKNSTNSPSNIRKSANAQAAGNSSPSKRQANSTRNTNARGILFKEIQLTRKPGILPRRRKVKENPANEAEIVAITLIKEDDADVLQYEPLVCMTVDAISALVSLPLDIPADLYSTVLESGLKLLLCSIPEATAKGGGDGKAEVQIEGRLWNRILSVTELLKTLLFHAHSWLGASRLLQAVFSYGGDSPTEFVRWVCTHLMRVICLHSPILKTSYFGNNAANLVGKQVTSFKNTNFRIDIDKITAAASRKLNPHMRAPAPENLGELGEFCECLALILPRTGDSCAAISHVALDAAQQCLMRCEFTVHKAGTLVSNSFQHSAAVMGARGSKSQAEQSAKNARKTNSNKSGLNDRHMLTERAMIESIANVIDIDKVQSDRFIREHCPGAQDTNLLKSDKTHHKKQTILLNKTSSSGPDYLGKEALFESSNIANFANLQDGGSSGSNAKKFQVIESLAPSQQLATILADCLPIEAFPVFVHHLLPSMRDCDENASACAADALHLLLTKRAGQLNGHIAETIAHVILFEVENHDLAVAEQENTGVLKSNDRNSAILETYVRERLLSCLKILAMHHFKAVIDRVLTEGPDFESCHIELICALAKEKTLLVKLISELTDILNHIPQQTTLATDKNASTDSLNAQSEFFNAEKPELSIGNSEKIRAATVALGHIFAVEDSTIKMMVQKYFTQIFFTFLMRLGVVSYQLAIEKCLLYKQDGRSFTKKSGVDKDTLDSENLSQQAVTYGENLSESVSEARMKQNLKELAYYKDYSRRCSVVSVQSLSDTLWSLEKLLTASENESMVMALEYQWGTHPMRVKEVTESGEFVENLAMGLGGKYLSLYNSVVPGNASLRSNLLSTASQMVPEASPASSSTNTNKASSPRNLVVQNNASSPSKNSSANATPRSHAESTAASTSVNQNSARNESPAQSLEKVVNGGKANGDFESALFKLQLNHNPNANQIVALIQQQVGTGTVGWFFEKDDMTLFLVSLFLKFHGNKEKDIESYAAPFLRSALCVGQRIVSCKIVGEMLANMQNWESKSGALQVLASIENIDNSVSNLVPNTQKFPNQKANDEAFFREAAFIQRCGAHLKRLANENNALVRRNAVRGISQLLLYWRRALFSELRTAELNFNAAEMLNAAQRNENNQNENHPVSTPQGMSVPATPSTNERHNHLSINSPEKMMGTVASQGSFGQSMSVSASIGNVQNISGNMHIFPHDLTTKAKENMQKFAKFRSLLRNFFSGPHLFVPGLPDALSNQLKAENSNSNDPLLSAEVVGCVALSLQLIADFASRVEFCEKVEVPGFDEDDVNDYVVENGKLVLKNNSVNSQNNTNSSINSQRVKSTVEILLNSENRLQQYFMALQHMTDDSKDKFISVENVENIFNENNNICAEAITSGLEIWRKPFLGKLFNLLPASLNSTDSHLKAAALQLLGRLCGLGKSLESEALRKSQIKNTNNSQSLDFTEKLRTETRELVVTCCVRMNDDNLIVSRAADGCFLNMGRILFENEENNDDISYSLLAMKQQMGFETFIFPFFAELYKERRVVAGGKSSAKQSNSGENASFAPPPRSSKSEELLNDIFGGNPPKKKDPLDDLDDLLNSKKPQQINSTFNTAQAITAATKTQPVELWTYHLNHSRNYFSAKMMKQNNLPSRQLDLSSVTAAGLSAAAIISAVKSINPGLVKAEQKLVNTVTEELMALMDIENYEFRTKLSLVLSHFSCLA